MSEDIKFVINVTLNLITIFMVYFLTNRSNYIEFRNLYQERLVTLLNELDECFMIVNNHCIDIDKGRRGDEFSAKWAALDIEKDLYNEKIIRWGDICTELKNIYTPFSQSIKSNIDELIDLHPCILNPNYHDKFSKIKHEILKKL